MFLSESTYHRRRFRMSGKSKPEKVLESAGKATWITLLTMGAGALIDMFYENQTGKKSNTGTAIGTAVGALTGTVLGISDIVNEVDEAVNENGKPTD
jgi:hypothetical protein